mmetsp:Transcript_129262/g.192528  ORF Transcript_129262/g.192528 Transcript_129262/m.192528 type:complete len:147 (+) Transcript_129262:2-442(+)
MRGLMGDHWEPCEVCRGYERLGWADIVRMHGFVIVKLRGRDARDDCKFMRLDWGHDGFLFQTGPTDQEFRAYCGEPSADVGELATSLIQALSVAPAERDYAVVGPRVSMKMLIAEIDSKKHIAYDMALWNCNHFANNLMEVLTKED